VVVSRPADLPWLETRRLLAALRRLGLAVGALVVNAVADAGCPRCRRIAGAERRALDRLADEGQRLAGPRAAFVVAPAEVPPPRGPAAIARWQSRWSLYTA
jgi:hypothetical protein